MFFASPPNTPRAERAPRIDSRLTHSRWSCSPASWLLLRPPQSTPAIDSSRRCRCCRRPPAAAPPSTTPGYTPPPASLELRPERRRPPEAPPPQRRGPLEVPDRVARPHRCLLLLAHEHPQTRDEGLHEEREVDERQGSHRRALRGFGEGRGEVIMSRSAAGGFSVACSGLAEGEQGRGRKDGARLGEPLAVGADEPGRVLEGHLSVCGARRAG